MLRNSFSLPASGIALKSPPAKFWVLCPLFKIVVEMLNISGNTHWLLECRSGVVIGKILFDNLSLLDSHSGKLSIMQEISDFLQLCGNFRHRTYFFQEQ